MNVRRVVVFGEGRHELGPDLGNNLAANHLPALPRLVHRLAGQPGETTYTCLLFRDVRPVHGKGHSLAKKVRNAVREAKLKGFAAAVVVIDRDRNADTERIRPLRQGRDLQGGEGYPPCAVGAAVETFDAWMIADPKAIMAAQGDAEKAHGSPESLDGKEGSARHPKDVAASAFGGKKGLSARYAAVAETVDLELLRKRCPKGFAPFANEVETRILPVVS